jgi:hypothetical protein
MEYRLSRVAVRRLASGLLLAAGLVLLTACGGGGDASPTEAPQIVETAAPAEPTATVQPDPDPVATETAEATSTREPTATTTPSPTPVPPTMTPTVTPSPTPTPLPTVDIPFGDTQPVVEALPNFTMTYTARFDGDSDDEGSVELRVEQYSPEMYHLRVSTDDQRTEAWRVGDVIYVLGPGGSVVELPGMVDRNLYAPASFLMLVPELDGISVATVVETDVNVNGRSATHYEIDPSTASEFRPSESEIGDDVEGVFEVWVDNELNVIVQIEADIEWTNADGVQSMQMRYLITEIGTTPEIQPPA